MLLLCIRAASWVIPCTPPRPCDLSPQPKIDVRLHRNRNNQVLLNSALPLTQISGRDSSSAGKNYHSARSVPRGNFVIVETTLLKGSPDFTDTNLTSQPLADRLSDDHNHFHSEHVVVSTDRQF